MRMWYYSYVEHMNETTLRKIHWGESRKSRQQELGIDLFVLSIVETWSLCLKTSKRSRRYCGSLYVAKTWPCKQRCCHPVILNSARPQTESNSFLSFNNASRWYSTLGKLPAVFSAVQISPVQPSSHHLPNETGEKTTFSAKHFNLVLYSKTIAKIFYINLIHRRVHKGTTTENTASWFMSKKFTLYLH